MNGGTGGGKALVNKALPNICITTTVGTGSEADQWGVITNDETNEKIGFGGYDCLFPVLAVVDPGLMVSVPPKFTAYQGFDTLFHSTECYVSKMHNLMGEMVLGYGCGTPSMTKHSAYPQEAYQLGNRLK